MKKVLIIGVWGFPGSWYLANYEIIKPPEKIEKWIKLSKWEWSGETIATHSTTVAITDMFLKRNYEVHIQIYGLDTLASPLRIDPKMINKNDIKRKELVQKLNELIIKYYDEEPRNYNEIKTRAKEVLRTFINSYFEEIKSDGIKKENIGLEILPGIGSYRLVRQNNGREEKRYEFIGSPQNTLLALEFDLFNRVERIDPDAIVLDISHGINYLPTIAVEAVMRVARIHSALHRKPVFVAVLNSDPVNNHGQRAKIHLVSVSQVNEEILDILRNIVSLPTDEHVFRMLKGDKPSCKVKLLDTMIKGRVIKEYVPTAKTLVQQVEYGLVLYSLTMQQNISLNDVESLIEDLKKTIKDSIQDRKINRNNAHKSIRIYHDYALQPNIIMDSLYLLTLLKEILIKTGKHKNNEPLINIDTLKKYAEEIGLSSVGRIIFENEISDIKRRVRGIIERLRISLGKPIPYAIIYDLYNELANIPSDSKNIVMKIKDYDTIKQALIKIINGEYDIEIKCDINKRNFFAHAGFERNAINIAVRDSTILVGYRDECREQIDRILKELDNS